MRKNKLFLLGIFTVMVALVSLTLVSNTWAKYTSTVSGSDSARVAKWEFDFNDGDIDLQSAKTVTFNLFNTVYEADGTTAENNVETGAGDTVIIAPGTGGSFQFHIDNKSEVYATYTVTFSETESADVPVQYSLDGSEWKDSIEELSISATELEFGGASTTHKVQWRWAFEGDDATDTALGYKVTPDTVQVTMTVTFTQVD